MICRALFIILNSIIITVLFIGKNLIITPSVLSIVLLLQIVELHFKNRRSQDKIISFLESLIENEEVHSEVKNSAFYSKLKMVFDNLISQSKTSNILAEKNSELLDVILHQIKIGIIVYYDDGEVFLINKAARRLLSVNYLNSIGKNILDKLEISSSMHSDSCEFLLDQKRLTILSFQNIKQALDNKEMDSWNELIRTLNHEIMNSITPISSLANSALTLTDDSSNPDLIEALQVIENRSRNLLKFVKNYRSISQIPTPKQELIVLKELLDKISTLMVPYLKEYDIKLNIKIDDEQLKLYVDPMLFENVIINLIKNSVEAKSNIIQISSYFEGDETFVVVSDDGVGLSKESMSKAFLPFYTTKTDGSGLGLSLVRQIMFVHNGSVIIDEVKNGSKLSLVFP
ncbi:MAG: ATP-binding protein [Spirochaetaceae bacterium]